MAELEFWCLILQFYPFSTFEYKMANNIKNFFFFIIKNFAKLDLLCISEIIFSLSKYACVNGKNILQI